jgi:hypothetical protein
VNLFANISASVLNVAVVIDDHRLGFLSLPFAIFFLRGNQSNGKVLSAGSPGKIFFPRVK